MPMPWPPVWPEKRLAVMVGILNRMKPAMKHSISRPGMTVISLCGLVHIHRSAGQIGDEQMTHHTHRCRSDHFVELKTKKCFEPSPEEKVGLVENHPRDKHGPEKSNDGCSDCAVGDDYAKSSSQEAQDKLHCDTCKRACKVR